MARLSVTSARHNELEAILVSLLGVTVGVGLTFAARFGVMRMTTLVVEVEPRWIGIALLLGIVGGSIGALYPALRAAMRLKRSATNSSQAL